MMQDNYSTVSIIDLVFIFDRSSKYENGSESCFYFTNMRTSIMR